MHSGCIVDAGAGVGNQTNYVALQIIHVEVVRLVEPHHPGLALRAVGKRIPSVLVFRRTMLLSALSILRDNTVCNQFVRMLLW